MTQAETKPGIFYSIIHQGFRIILEKYTQSESIVPVVRMLDRMFASVMKQHTVKETEYVSSTWN